MTYFSVDHTKSRDLYTVIVFNTANIAYAIQEICLFNFLPDCCSPFYSFYHYHPPTTSSPGWMDTDALPCKPGDCFPGQQDIEGIIVYSDNPRGSKSCHVLSTVF